MKNKLNYIIGIISYILAILLIIYYLILEFSIINVTSPVNRLIIVTLVVILMYLGFFFLRKTKNKMFLKLARFNIIVWFILYLIMILNLTLFDKYFGRDYLVNSLQDILDVEQMKREFMITANITPFRTINNFYIGYQNGNVSLEYFLRNIVGNLIAFTPLAFFLPRLFKSINKWYKFFIITSIFIIGIEFCQFFMNSGAFDVDDYILNISGTMIIYILINNKFIRKLLDKIFFLNEEEVR